MRKKLATIVLSMFAVAAMAQDTDSRKANIDWKEDSVEITTIKDIVRTQQAVTSRTATAAHFDKVWKNHGFFNVAYHTKATLDPVATYNLLKKNNEEAKYIETGVAYNGRKAPKYTNNWGASIMAGKNIKLHKPIANTLQFNIDFTGIDLSVSHYSTEPGENDDKKGVYDSKATFDFKNEKGVSKGDRRYSHWNLEKYDISYGMSIGPSFTLAPFTYVKDARGLHFVKFNVYYHVGYNVAMMLMLGDSDSDVSADGTEESDRLNENQLLLGHNLYQTFGFNMTWRRIGFGYEHRWGNLKYKNLIAKSEYGEYSYKFNTTINRIYFTYRFGK